MRNIKLLIEYDGTEFVGWQVQPNGRTVQEELEKTLMGLLQETVNVIGAGRTDSGVHARGQVANFRTQSTLDLHIIKRGLNGLLSKDIVVHNVEEVSENFHARYDAKERVYRYYISQQLTALNRKYCWYLHYKLDYNVMNECAKAILGEHNFQSFCIANSAVKHHCCIVHRAQWIQQNQMLIFDIAANRFLHGMVRALVGTMVDVGRNFLTIDDFHAIMAANNRTAARASAPPRGLFLEQVNY
jgi:tRNA pseudouridine38-40 synthase